LLFAGLPALESSIERLNASEGEFGSGGTLGARFVDDELAWEVPVGDVGCAPFGAPGLLAPPFLPPPRKRPLLQRLLVNILELGECMKDGARNDASASHY